MFIVYHSVTKPLTSKNLPDEPCPVCGKKGGIEVTLYMKYLVALLPVFGLGRRTGVHCSLCAHEIKNPDAHFLAKQNYSASIAEAIKDIRATYKRTLWQLLYPWSFCLVFLLLIGFAWLSSMRSRSRMNHTKELLADPRAGDIYRARWRDIQSSTERGVLVKLNRIEGDTMFVTISQASIPISYSASAWAALSPADDAFLPQVYKLQLSKFKESTDFFAYPETTGTGDTADRQAQNSPFSITSRQNRPVYICAPINNGHAVMEVDGVERKEQH